MRAEMEKISAQIAKRSGQCDDEGRPRRHNYMTDYWCAKALVAIVAGSVLTWYYIHEEQPPIGSNRYPTAASSSVDFMHPPQPYTYKTFMDWLRSTDFSQFPNIKWQPEVAEFDLDAAANGKKFGPYLTDSQGASALKVAKGINKLLFMDDIILSGDLTAIGGPGTHLYILAKLSAASKASSQPTFLDAGCGSGYLLMAWVLATGSQSRSIGIDISSDNVASAKRHLFSHNALDVHAADQLPPGVKMQVQVGDALRPEATRLAIAPGTVDAINVGLAVKTVAELAPLSRLLREGGLMAVPICLPDAEQSKDVPAGRCDGLLQILKKSSDGSLEREPGDPDIPVRFIVAVRQQSNEAASGNKLRGSSR
jgi:SAM-dependent methyltransferase